MRPAPLDRARRRRVTRRSRLVRAAVITISVTLSLATGAAFVLTSGDEAAPAATDPPATVSTTPAPAPTTPSPTPTPVEPTSVPDAGEGSFATASGDGERAGDSGTFVEYRVEVEDGLGFDTDRFARAVESTLGDERGWTADGAYSFRRTSDAALRVVLASPDTTDELCAPLQTEGEVSCRNGDDVVINAVRWVEGVEFYDDLAEYRQYLVNHEVGHALGFGHTGCPEPGTPAPVMLQQTLGLDGCTANPWP